MGKTTFAVDIDGTITEDNGETIHLGALSSLRHMMAIDCNVIFVTGRSSVEAFLLSVFGGTTRIVVGENGGCITTSPTQHTLLGDKKECVEAAKILATKFNVVEKPVFPRLTEIVLERTFDVKLGRKMIAQKKLNVELADSQYALHINSKGIDKGIGFGKVMNMLNVRKKDVIAIGDSETDIPLFEMANTSVALANASKEVKEKATITTNSKFGEGLVEAMDLIR